MEQALNDFDNLSPRKKTSMKSMKSRKRKTEKSEAKLSKKSKPVKADEFLDVEAEEGDLIFLLFKFLFKSNLQNIFSDV